MARYFLILFVGFLMSGYTRAQNHISVSGNKLVDECGNTVFLTGVNWFGFETGNKCPHGLWARDYQGMLDQIKSLGFNCIRLPWSNEIMEPTAMPTSIGIFGSDPFNGRSPMNHDLDGLTALEVMDKVIDYCGQINLKIILDNHSRKADGFLGESLWYTNDVSEAQWIADWVELVKRYKNNDAIIGADLNNEPHGNATWASGDTLTDWNMAAEKCGNAILAENPNLLIIVEGIEFHKGHNYWWGGNLRGIKSNPIILNDSTKLVYSAHEYGPEVFQQNWFNEGTFPSNMKVIWDSAFGYIHNENIGHLFIGEFGIKDSSAFGGKALQWFDEWIKYAGNNFSWTFWSWNPNSGDTGGILDDDWSTVNQWKVDRLAPYLFDSISNCVSSASAEVSENEDMSVYPNPTGGYLYFKLTALEDIEELELINVFGETILNIKPKSSFVKVPVSGLSSGCYLISVSMVSGHEVSRIIIN